MSELKNMFNERVKDVDVYFEFLEKLDKNIKEGNPHFRVTIHQQQILFSSVYLQLYNLIEATITMCLSAIAEKVVESNLHPLDLSQEMRKEWARFITRSDKSLNAGNRLEEIVKLCDSFLSGFVISKFDIKKGASGNWADDEIEKLKTRIGMDFTIDQDVERAIKLRVRDDLSVLKSIRFLRNKLAHGSMSFRECGSDVTFSQLSDLKTRTCNYLGRLVEGFEWFVSNRQYLSSRGNAIQGCA